MPSRRLLLVATVGQPRDAFVEALSGADLVVDVAADDDEARTRADAAREPPLAVVIDTDAGVHPWSLLEWLRLQGRFDQVPVILVGAGAAEEPIALLAEPCTLVPRDTPLEDLRAALVALRERTRPILVVDDDLDYAEATAHLLQGAGYRTEVVPSAAAAVEFLDRSDAAAVLLDRSMPAMDGTELFSWIRAQRRFARLPVVFVSGDPPPRRADQMNHDRSYWLSKPVAPALLLKVVREHVRS